MTDRGRGDDVVDCGDDGGGMGVTGGRFTVCEQPAVIEETGPTKPPQFPPKLGAS